MSTDERRQKAKELLIAYLDSRVGGTAAKEREAQEALLDFAAANPPAQSEGAPLDPGRLETIREVLHYARMCETAEELWRYVTDESDPLKDAADNLQALIMRGAAPEGQRATDLEEAAWVVIANAMDAMEDWTEWTEAAKKWRDAYLAKLARLHPAAPEPTASEGVWNPQAALDSYRASAEEETP